MERTRFQRSRRKGKGSELSLTSDELATESPGSAKGKEVSGSIRRFESEVRKQELSLSHPCSCLFSTPKPPVWGDNSLPSLPPLPASLVVS